MQRIRTALGLAAAALLLIAACGGADHGAPDGQPDGGAVLAGQDSGDADGSTAADAGTSDAGTSDAGSSDAGSDADAGADAGHNVDAGPDAGADGGLACPPGTAAIPGAAVCIDRWEGALLEELPDGGTRTWSPYLNPGTAAVRAESSAGRQPQGYISGTQAAAACGRAGKRLCALSEWLAACQGAAKRTYPYGTAYVAHACNEGRTPHPVVEFYGTSVGVWDSPHMNDAGINQQENTVANSGAFTRCVTPEGVADLVGNLHEWVADGSFKGGYYVDAKINGNGCLYRTTAHAASYHDYSTGFRCCSDR